MGFTIINKLCYNVPAVAIIAAATPVVAGGPNSLSKYPIFKPWNLPMFINNIWELHAPFLREATFFDIHCTGF